MLAQGSMRCFKMLCSATVTLNAVKYGGQTEAGVKVPQVTNFTLDLRKLDFQIKYNIHLHLKGGLWIS